MGYRIVYGRDPVIQKKRTNTARIRIMIALSFLFFAWTVRFLWPEGRELLTIYLLPGDPTITEAAFSNLLESVRLGEGIMDAMTVFCREILHEIV